MDWKLELVSVPVSDVDRAKAFYEGLGWRVDADIARGDAFRVVQFTPPHSECSIAMGKGLGGAFGTDEMAAGSTDAGLYDRYARRQSEFEHRGGYTWRDRATRVLHNLGFKDEDMDRLLATFSGGQLTRASLGRALAAQPDLLLLDEPTNHLDIGSLEWLEDELKQLDAAIVMGLDDDDPLIGEIARRHVPLVGIDVRCRVHGAPVPG